jgi:hypothetical protein
MCVCVCVCTPQEGLSLLTTARAYLLPPYGMTVHMYNLGVTHYILLILINARLKSYY